MIEAAGDWQMVVWCGVLILLRYNAGMAAYHLNHFCEWTEWYCEHMSHVFYHDVGDGTTAYQKWQHNAHNVSWMVYSPVQGFWKHTEYTELLILIVI